MAILAYRAPRTRRSRHAKRRENTLVALGLALCSLQLILIPSHRLPQHISFSAPSDDLPLALAPDVMQTSLPDPQAPLSLQRLKQHGVPLVMVEGGIPSTRRSPQRTGVPAFVADSGAQAGLNGTFFNNASLHGTDNMLIGPTLCGNEASLKPDMAKAQNLTGRPLVLLAPERSRIVAYDPHTMDTDAGLRRLLPGVTDAFLGGVWLVHDGTASTPAQIDDYHVKDAEDPRRRAFFALTTDGRPTLGATDGVARSSKLARSLEGIGLSDAVLMDSGFSTSLVLGHHILVTGHTAPSLPSRPVPHAIVLFAPHSDPTLVNGAKTGPVIPALNPASTGAEPGRNQSRSSYRPTAY